jgi:hypothetical protein
VNRRVPALSRPPNPLASTAQPAAEAIEIKTSDEFLLGVEKR